MRTTFLCVPLVALAACGDASSTPAPALVSFAPGLMVVAPHLDGALLRAQHATAAIRMPYDFDADGRPLTAADGTMLVASCGATFIDAHHAITAGHCVSGQAGDPANRSVEADLFDDVPAGRTLPWQKTTTLTGSFPAFEHERLTAADGYVVHELTCHVVASCLGTPIAPAVSTRCPVETMQAGADVALLRCDEDLPPGHGSMAIATTPIALGDAMTYLWYHELYFAAQDASAQSLDDLYQHWTLLTPDDPGANFHYYGWNENQLLPLASLPFSVDGTTVPQRVLAIDGRGVVTDLFACHGSSGSGGLRLDPTSGEYELVGPAVSLADDATIPGVLCPTQVRAGRQNLAFAPPEQVRAIAALR